VNLKNIVLHLAKGMGLFALSRLLTRGIPRILCYHGGSLGDEHLFNPKLFCRPGLLDQRLHWLARKGFVPSSLDSLLEHNSATLRDGTPVIVTLDDGWHSSSTDLLPVLACHGYRPVLYLATKVFASGAPVIDVCLRYIVWKSPLASVTLHGLHPEINGLYRLDQTADRERLYIAAERWLALLGDDPTTCHIALERLAVGLSVPVDVLDLASKRFGYMSQVDLLAAVQHGCHIELHGHAHLYVNGQPEQNRLDIEACRQHILALGLPQPRHYCYPSGTHDDQAPAMLTSANVSTATTCMPGLVHSVTGDRRYFLPRFLDGDDVTFIEFQAEMSGVLEFLRRMVGRTAQA